LANPKLILSPVIQPKCGKGAFNKKLVKRSDHVLIEVKNRQKFRLMTVTVTMMMALSVHSVRDYCLVTTKAKRGLSERNVFNGRAKSVARERTKHLYAFLYLALILNRSRGSSVSIVSDYRLYDRDSIPGRGKGFFL
jgi:hypothetical protein